MSNKATKKFIEKRIIEEIIEIETKINQYDSVIRNFEYEHHIKKGWPKKICNICLKKKADLI